MNKDYKNDSAQRVDELNKQVQGIIGLGNFSAKKSYYPKLQEIIKELELERNKFQRIISQAQYGICQINKKGKVILTNPELYRILKAPSPISIESDEFNFSSLFHETSEFDAFISKVEDCMKCKNHETQFICFDRSTINVSIYASYQEGKSEPFIELFIQDITKQKETEKALQQSEKVYRAIFESTGTATMIIDNNTSIKLTNNELIDLTGYGSQELIGRSWTEFVQPEDLSKMMKHHTQRRLSATGVPSKYQVRLVHRSGETRTVILHANLIPNTTDSVVSFVDITEQVTATKALKNSEEYFRALIENASDVISIIGLDGTVLYESPSHERVLGYSMGEITGQLAFPYIHPDDLEKTKQMFLELGKTPSAKKTAQFRFKHKDGHYLTIEGTGHNLSHLPLVNGIVFNYRDVSDKVAAEQKLLLHQQNLEHAVQLRTRELEEKNQELERFNRLFVGRELRIKELRDEVKDLNLKIVELQSR